MTALVSQGAILRRGDGATPTETFNAVGNVISISGIGGGSPAEIDVTSLSSTGKEFILGLKDEGEISIALNLDTADAEQDGLRTDRDAGTLRNFEVQLTDSTPSVISFAAYVKTFNISLGVDEKINLECSLRISGAVTWTP